MTKAERDALRADAQRKAGKTVTAAAKVAEEKAVAKARDENLDDPKTQAKIEVPETIELILRLPGQDGALVTRLVAISLSFTHEQVYDWNLFEDLQSFAVLMRGELLAAQFNAGDADAYTAALTTSRVRVAVRRILVKIATYVEPWVTHDTRDREIRHVRPTEDELRAGIVLESGESNLYAMRGLADVLFGMYAREVERQKNARAAAVPN